MRLHEMYYSIKNTLDSGIQPEIVEEKSKTEVWYRFSNTKEIIDLLEPLRVLPEVNETFTQLNEISQGITGKNSCILNASDRGRVLSIFKNLTTCLESMLSLCETLGVKRESQGFDVKLPPELTLQEAAQCMKDLDKVLSQCPLFPQDEKIQFEGVDIGSVWLVFTIIGGTLATVGAVAALVDAAVIIRSHLITCKQQEENARTYHLANDLIENLSTAHKAMLDTILEDTTKKLADSHDIEDPEDLERLKFSIKMLSDLMDQGMEIYAGINSPAETKALFPPVTMQKLSLNLAGLLSEKSSTDPDDSES